MKTSLHIWSSVKPTGNIKKANSQKWVSVDWIKAFIMQEKRKLKYVELEQKGVILDMLCAELEGEQE